MALDLFKSAATPLSCALRRAACQAVQRAAGRKQTWNKTWTNTENLKINMENVEIKKENVEALNKCDNCGTSGNEYESRTRNVGPKHTASKHRKSATSPVRTYIFTHIK
jgi:hypothetical protein